MPANLTPQYYAAEERFKQAKDDREKLKALKEMLGMIPKHKGTEKLQAEIKRKIARLKEELEAGGGKRGARRFIYKVEREGAAQIGVVGPPNVGKTQLVNALANTNFEVGDYAFTTRIFQPAMMPYEDIQIQLIDFPPLCNEHLDNWLPSMIRICDMLLLILDLNNDDLLEEVDNSFEILKNCKIEIFNENVVTDDPRWTFLKTLILGNKYESAHAHENLKVLKELYEDGLTIYPISTTDQSVMNSLKAIIVKFLNIVRVYSKRPGHEPEMGNPFVFSGKSTLLDFAKAVHKDFSSSLKFARVWGENKFDGQRINKDYILEDKDIIELHI